MEFWNKKIASGLTTEQEISVCLFWLGFGELYHGFLF